MIYINRIFYLFFHFVGYFSRYIYKYNHGFIKYVKIIKYVLMFNCNDNNIYHYS